MHSEPAASSRSRGVEKPRSTHRNFFVRGTQSPLGVAWVGAQESEMDTTTLLIIIIIVLLVFGGGWYGRGRWF